jgi:hypothetical protein
MKSLMKYLGVILLLLGVVCLVLYKFSLPENWLLVSAMALEFVGIISYVLINKNID